ncbi:MAG: TnpV protein [Clostridia bacterium]|nr:TnpV protein [Clostridia bacterium]
MKYEFIGKIGVYGQMHYRYLRENKPSVLGVMRMKGTLRQYLEEVNTDAEEMLARLESEMAKNESVTEALKRQDQMAWVQRKNNIRARAMEIVQQEVIFV